jgi:hypothetical protein
MRFRGKGSGYSQIQKTRPQTLGYGLTDSPIGQAAWIYEKCVELAGDGISGDDVLSLDEVLDDITLYWLTATATSAARLYWESWDKDWGMHKVDIPVGCSIFPGVRHRCGQGARFRTCFIGTNSTAAVTLRPTSSPAFSSMKCERVSQ